MAKFEYDAFISYNSSDAVYARSLHYSLEHFRFDNLGSPYASSGSMKVFLDTMDFSSGGLRDEIVDALGKSRFLIVVCSPNAASSEWVNEEVSIFISMGRLKDIIPVIVGGIPNSSAPGEECFPYPLKGLPKEDQLIGINVTKDGKKVALVKVVARMTGQKFDSLWRRHERERKSFLREKISETFLIVVLGLIVAMLLIRLVDEIASKDDFLKNMPMRDDLRKESVHNIGPDAENLLFLDRNGIAYSVGEDIFKKTVGDTIDWEEKLEGHTGVVQCLDMSPDGNTLLSSSSDGTLRLWRASDGRQLVISERLDTLSQPWYTMLSSARFSPTGNSVWTVDMEGVKVWDGTRLRLRRKEESDIFYMSMGEISPDGRTMYVPYGEHGYSLYTRKGDSLSVYLPGQVEMMRYSPDGKSLMYSSVIEGERSILILDISRRALRKGLVSFTPMGLGEEFPYGISAASFSPDGKTLIVADSGGKVMIFNAVTGTLRESYLTGEENLSEAGFTPDGSSFYAYDRVSGNLHQWGPVVLVW